MLFKRRAIVASLVVALVILLGGTVATWLYHSRVVSQIEEAKAAFLREDWKQALAAYQRGRQFLDNLPWLRSLLVGDYHDALIGEVEILYATGKYEEGITLLNREAERSGKFSADPRRLLWTANLWFRRAIEEENELEQREQLNAALDLYRKGLEVAPDQWDLKFNYELATQILSQENPIKREKEEKDQKKRLLPRIRTDQQRQRRILPPEERG